MPRPAEEPRIDGRAVRQILDRYACPVPYHEVRTRFLGSIATPVIGASPVAVVQNLWGGELPEFESLEAANELIGILVNGLWNGLTRHQKRTEPFRVIRLVVPATRSWPSLGARKSTASSRGCLPVRTRSICRTSRTRP